MYKKIRLTPVLVIFLAVLAAACSPSQFVLPAELSETVNSVLERNPASEITEEQPVSDEPSPATPVEPGLLAAYENTLINIYEQVNPSVVNIRVVGQALPSTIQMPELFPDHPQIPENPNFQPPNNVSLGSGFVWDSEGHIITNNHVVDGAQKIEVTFSDESVASAELVGSDPDSDLAVIKVDVPAENLKPVQMGDSDSLRVGQLAIAIGNPFGLEGTMTVGIVSALGRTLPASDGMTAGPVYSIPDVIQTDAPINPGNSGGVLLNDMGEVIGVTAAIESPVRANAGVGFVIPASIVHRVVPELITSGSYEHPYLGISGTSLNPDLAKAMNLGEDQRGALVATIVSGGPADKAGLRGSDKQVVIDGMDMQVGGDVITAIDGNAVYDMDDLIAYLSAKTEVNQKVTLTVLRDGNPQEIEVTLEVRPMERVQNPSLPEESARRAWLGITGLALTGDLAEAMDLPADQQGVLVVEVQPGSPADEVGLIPGDTPFTVGGQEIMIGGDVILQVDGRDLSTVPELAAYFQEVGAGEQVALTVLRDGKTITVEVTLGEQP